MSPRKLTEATKKEILKLYRQTEATTSTLADRYGVSSSTISRFLKNSLTEVEYEELIQKKRLARTPRSSGCEGESVEEEEPVAMEKAEVVRVITEPRQLVLPVTLKAIEPAEEEAEPGENALDVATLPDFFDGEGESGENALDVATLPDFFDEEEDDEDDEDWEEDDEDDEGDEGDYRSEPLPRTTQLQVLPLSSAAFPKTCYLVIDRSAELITRPLKDFAELGKVPPQEIQQRTLPVFDSHRVARRFSKRRERVIKVPDGRLIEKAGSHLEAKGITRLLLDGRIYSLSPV
jgi:transposase-like protein